MANVIETRMYVAVDPHFNIFTPAEWLEKATQFAAKLTALELETAERLKI